MNILNDTGVARLVTKVKELVDAVKLELNDLIVKLTETVLYESETGTTGLVSLSDNIENYKRIRIYYYRKDNDHNSVEVEPKVGRRVDLKTAFVAQSGAIIQFGVHRISLNSDSISNADYDYHVNFKSDKTITEFMSERQIYIFKVVGYKY